MYFYKIAEEVGVDYKNAIPLRQSYLDGYYYCVFNTPMCISHYIEITAEEFESTFPTVLEPAPVPLTEAEQTQLEMSLNLDYLVTLADLGL